jgi:ribosome-associated protein
LERREKQLEERASYNEIHKEEIEKECDERPYHTEHGEKWTLVDYVNIVVHVFQHEHREFYSLESLWADAERTEY